MNFLFELLGLCMVCSDELPHQQLGESFNSIITDSYDTFADSLDSMSQGDDYGTGCNN